MAYDSDGHCNPNKSKEKCPSPTFGTIDIELYTADANNPKMHLEVSYKINDLGKTLSDFMRQREETGDTCIDVHGYLQESLVTSTRKALHSIIPEYSSNSLQADRKTRKEINDKVESILKDELKYIDTISVSFK